MDIVTHISLGELVDKITILEIKSLHIQDDDKIKNINKELKLLQNTLLKSLTDEQAKELIIFQTELKSVNLKLWTIEDEIRECERKKDFKSRFIELARSVYFTNDERANIKKKINVKFKSNLIEEKSYNNCA